MQEEVKFKWKEQKEERRKKVIHLIQKSRNVRLIVPETHERVTISTMALKEIFEGDERPALIFGVAELSKSEQKILKLGPKLATWSLRVLLHG